MTQRKTGRRAMPVAAFPEFDLGDLVTGESVEESDRPKYEQWRGWKVTYRSNIITAIMSEIRSGQQSRIVAALARIVLAWNFVDEDGEPLAQPTRQNFAAFGLPDDLLVALTYGFLECVRLPKAT